MSSREPVQPWNPHDFDPASAHAGGTAVLTGRAPAFAARSGMGASVQAAQAAATRPSTGWAPPALEERRITAATPKRGERELGYDDGFAAGREAGCEETFAQVEPALRALDGVIQQLQAAEAEFARERERNLTALALVVARKLVQQDVEARPEVLQTLVNRALELVPAGTPSEVRMNPADLEALVPAIEKLAIEGRVPAVQWVGDANLSRGSFVVDSPVRVVDGRVDTALRQLYERLDHD